MTNNAWNSQDPVQVAKGGTGVATLTGVLTGNGTSAVTANAVTQYGVLVGGASNAVSSTAVGTATHVLTSNGAGVAPTFQATGAAAGSVVQVQYTTNNSYVSNTSDIPQDDTIPQKTEGTEIITLAITPTSATNLLIISCYVPSPVDTIALFQDDTSNALAAICNIMASGQTLTHIMVAGTTAATTFKIRGGRAASSAWVINGYAGSRVFGGVSTVVFSITEIKV